MLWKPTRGQEIEEKVGRERVDAIGLAKFFGQAVLNAFRPTNSESVEETSIEKSGGTHLYSSLPGYESIEHDQKENHPQRKTMNQRELGRRDFTGSVKILASLSMKEATRAQKRILEGPKNERKEGHLILEFQCFLACWLR